MSQKRSFPAWAVLLSLLALLPAPPTAIAASDSAVTLAVGALDETADPFQTNVFRVSAAAGPLRVRGYAGDGEIFHVMVKDLATGEVLFNELLVRDSPEGEVGLPQAGQYEVALTRVMADGVTGHGGIFTMTGAELAAADLQVPALHLLDFPPYAEMAEPFDTEARVLPGTPAAYLRLTLDGSVLRENLLQADGTAEQVVIDPAELAEGVHLLVAESQSPGSVNRAAVIKEFFVDLADSFADVSRSHWARKPVELMSDSGIINGRGGGLFDPEAPVTREEFAKMLALTLGVEAETAAAQFADIPAGHWSAPHVAALAENGWIRGETSGGRILFVPGRTITRAEAATIIGRTLGIEDAALPQGRLAFSDAEAIPAWAGSSVSLLAEQGWLNGFPDGHFGPAETLTRAQAARILSRYAGL